MKIKLLFTLYLSFCFFPGSALVTTLSRAVSLEYLQKLSAGIVPTPQDGIFNAPLSSLVRVRLFTEFTPDYVIFTVNEGHYQLFCGSDSSVKADPGDMFIIARADNKTIVRKRNGESLTGDTVEFRGRTGEERFSLRVNVSASVKRNYIGDLRCFSDMGSLLLINTLDIEKYVEGVVMAEGGPGKEEEYLRTQAVIARTYTYKYFDKHKSDCYNLCDDTHCQAYNGTTEDRLIMKAVRNTSGIVITTADSNLIISAFHSNCGGETSPSEYVWATGQPYLKKVVDPYCQSSRNATWERKIGINDWKTFLMKNGYRDTTGSQSLFTLNQISRARDYILGSFTLPLSVIRSAFDLRSTWFSISSDQDSLLFRGRGYGHGVGICQEGAMEMAARGFTYKQIIEFYYSGVTVMKIDNARKISAEK